MDAACDPERIGAVILEPILGEAGVIVPSSDYLAGVRQLCSDRNILLIMDEIQTGLGRTGNGSASSIWGSSPTWSPWPSRSGTACPSGRCWARAEVAAAFVPGDHGSTFGGQPLAMSAARATLAVMEAENVPERARRAGDRLGRGLAALPNVNGVRGEGLLLAAELTGEFAPAACRVRARQPASWSTPLDPTPSGWPHRCWSATARSTRGWLCWARCWPRCRAGGPKNP